MKRDAWIFLFAIGLLIFTGPFMSMVSQGLVLYLFILWLVFIVLIFIGSLFSDREEDGG